MNKLASQVVVLAATVCLVAAGCDDSSQSPEDGDLPAGGSCEGGLVFTVCPVDLDDVSTIVPLGNLNPPGHTFPTDHIYWYLRAAGSTGVTVETPLYAPGDMTLTSATASHHVNAGLTDFGITMECGDVVLILGHVTTLAENIFGNSTDLSGWDLQNEYSTGGETYRMYSKQFNRAIEAGDSLGTAGGNPGQWALDIGTYDLSATSGTAANPSRWQNSWYRHAVCPLDFYEAGPVVDAIWALVARDGGAGDMYPCGQALQDVPGAAHGCWFLDGVTEPYPEDNHLALVWHNTQPALAAISVGTMIPTLTSGVYTFTPENTGALNRDFSDVTADGAVYGYTTAGLPGGVIIVSLPTSNTLWIEHLPSATTNPASWVFTAAKTLFNR
jgi:hypothetical protein